MECNAREQSHCLNFTTDDLDRLESIQEIYFKTREIEEEDEEDVDLDSSSSSDENDHPDQEDDTVELMDVHVTERAKVQTFYAETWELETQHAVQLSPLMTSSSVETTAMNYHLPNSTWSY